MKCTKNLTQITCKDYQRQKFNVLLMERDIQDYCKICPYHIDVEKAAKRIAGEEKKPWDERSWHPDDEKRG